MKGCGSQFRGVSILVLFLLVIGVAFGATDMTLPFTLLVLALAIMTIEWAISKSIYKTVPHEA